MGWSTPIVAPPDGAMSDYMASLQQARRAADEQVYLPGHGGAVRDAPRFVAAYILHRKAREASILHRLGKGATDIPTIVRAIYIGLDPRLTNAAGFSVLAHLEDLVARGEVATDGPPVDRRRLSAGAVLSGLRVALLALLHRLGRACRASHRPPRRRSPRRARRCAPRWCRSRGGRSARPSGYRRARRRDPGGCAPRRRRGSP